MDAPDPDEVDRTCEEAINYLDSLKPAGKEDIVQYFLKVRELHHQELAKRLEKEIRIKRFIEEFDREQDEPSLIDWLND